ncbi:MAG: glutamine--fructose-6-phosphate transaminase (isomerizing) [Myxococcales bacterium]|nr:glutamine--fructose-6-phosphate transaminase (isomerizing) [Myxococcota bacterium]MDW8281693.1 glutamine--fructose-6-phosphate transaminase (isomerizing) [Myxococcales bacterium]
MCGIVGYIGEREVTPILIEGLRRLEYRGYDSAGIAVLDAAQGNERRRVRVVRCRGKLSALEALLRESRPVGRIGIGHTRWATHGRPSDENAHPHQHGSVAVVHNGIIENYVSLRQSLSQRGHRFQSETDTEIIAHLVDEELRRGGDKDLLAATRRALKQVEGAYAIVVLSEETPGELVCAKNASPLVVGLGEGEMFIASDVPAILPYTRRVIFLEEGDLAQVSAQGVRIVDLDGRPRERPIKEITWSAVAAEKAGYKHFMLKEIHEQARAVTDTLRGRLQHDPPDALLDGFELDPARVRRMFLIACGTSFHAAKVGEYMIEQWARVPVEVDLASEFRYRDPIVGPGDVVVAISQSGETADTLAAVKDARSKGALILSIANVVDSSIPRASNHTLYTHAGPEIGVASTKAFTTQLAALAVLAIHMGRRSGALSATRIEELLHELSAIPAKMNDVVAAAAQIQILARRYGHARDFLFLGRGPQFPIALEGALKLKEISYIHAEGYAAGEMKHGPIALIDENLPVVVLAPRDGTYDKVMSNLQEVKARGGTVIAVANKGDSDVGAVADEVILVPQTVPLLQPLLTVIPLQLLAYYVADFKGTDVDQPRNLAKSVTVE